MLDEKTIRKYLPLSEATYYILLTLVEPLHGYGVMQKVEEISKGAVTIGPGTLYGAFSHLEKENLIVMTGQEERRKLYTLTEKGRQVLLDQIRRIEMMADTGREMKKKLDTMNGEG
ncbi:MAG: PadR family transcriptional regulator [Anaerolineaceae bacterium]|nr:PadR family transcriptional regulator [Anaerolineaceae bacterium]